MRKICIYALLIWGVLCAQAQTLSTEITVDRTIVPEQIASAPLTTVAPSLMTPARFADDLTISEFAGAYGLHAYADSVAPALFPGLPNPSPWRGYASLGYFPAYRLGAQAGYKILDTERTALQASARFGGCSYHNHTDGNNDAVSNNNFDVDARFSHNFGKHVLGIQGLFGVTGVKHPTAALTEQSQRYTSARLDVSFGRETSRYGYGLKLGLDRLAAGKDVVTVTPAASGTCEAAANTLCSAAVHGRYTGASGKSSVSLDAAVKVLDRSGLYLRSGYWFNGAASEPGWNAHALVSTSTSLVTVNPAYTYRSRTLTVRVGAMLNVATGLNRDHDNTMLRVSPDVKAVWSPAGSFSIWGRYTSGMDFNTLRNQLDYSPFASAFNCSDPMRRLNADASAGIEYGRPDDLRIAIRGGYRDWDWAAMPVDAADFTGTAAFGGFSLHDLWAEAAAGYTFVQLHSLSVDLSYRLSRNDEHDGSPLAPDGANSVLKAKIGAQPIEALSVSLAFEHRGGRSMRSAGSSRLGLGSVNNLSLSALYRFSPRLDFGLEMHNLLCRRYLVLPGLSSQTLSGLLSATYRF